MSIINGPIHGYEPNSTEFILQRAIMRANLPVYAHKMIFYKYVKHIEISSEKLNVLLRVQALLHKLSLTVAGKEFFSKAQSEAIDF